jgi:hypothetical protein
MTIVEEIKNHIKKIFSVDNKDNIRMINISGHSGDPVFMIYDREKSLCVAKIFSTHKSFNNEFESYKFFKSIESETPEIISHIKHKEHYVLFMSAIEHQSVNDYIIKNFGNNEEILKTGIKIGELARKIHGVKRVSVDDMAKSMYVTNKIIIKKLQKAVNFTKASVYTVKKYLENPGNFTYCHGDINLDNIFISSNKDNCKETKLIIIDGGNYKGTRYRDPFMNKDNLPSGFPACDYNRFIGSIIHMIKKKKIPKVSGDILIEGFIKGYGDQYDIFTKEADELFKHYWAISCKYTLKY